MQAGLIIRGFIASPSDVMKERDEALLKILVCPQDRSSLALADSKLVAQLNALIDQGTLRNRGGALVTGPLDGGLVRADGTVLYPVLQDIPVLLVEESIEIATAGG